MTKEEERRAWEVIEKVSPEIEVPNLTRDKVDKVTVQMVVQNIRSTYTRNADGTSTKLPGGGIPMVLALEDIAPASRLQEWRDIETNGGEGGLSEEDIAELNHRLERGIDVPIAIGTWRTEHGEKVSVNGHAMMISDVRGEGNDRKYLISDPALGKTSWVWQFELQNLRSNWPHRYFKQKAKGLTSMVLERSAIDTVGP
jgi:hypothetical protein